MAACPGLPPATSLESMSDDQRGMVLDILFEPSPSLRQLALPLLRVRHDSYGAVIDTVHSLLLSLHHTESPAQRAQLDAILGSHPRLGAAKVDSAQSAAEQAHLRDHASALQALNDDYEACFPGLRYIVFVNGIGGRDAVFRDIRARIERSSPSAERDAAIQAVCDIARDRASKLV